jgi:hypothetical protein
MARRGRKRQLEVEARYWRLLATGVGTVEACRLVGITRKTGYRWRAENGGVPPDRLDEASGSNQYLSRLERQRIATLRGWARGPRDRSSGGPLRVDDQPGVAAQCPPARRVLQR